MNIFISIRLLFFISLDLMCSETLPNILYFPTWPNELSYCGDHVWCFFRLIQPKSAHQITPFTFQISKIFQLLRGARPPQTPQTLRLQIFPIQLIRPLFTSTDSSGRPKWATADLTKHTDFCATNVHQVAPFRFQFSKIFQLLRGAHPASDSPRVAQARRTTHNQTSS